MVQKMRYAVQHAIANGENPDDCKSPMAPEITKSKTSSGNKRRVAKLAVWAAGITAVWYVMNQTDDLVKQFPLHEGAKGRTNSLPESIEQDKADIKKMPSAIKNAKGFSDSMAGILERHESNISHLYLDSKGKPHVGIGEYMETAEEFMTLPMKKEDGKYAYKKEKHQAYNSILAERKRLLKKHKGSHKKAFNYKAEHYEGVTSLRLDPEDARQRLSDYIEHKALPPLVEKFPKFEKMPKPAQVALVDMEYNMGGVLNERSYGKFFKAVNEGNWIKASGQCDRKWAGTSRNEWTKQMFLEAAAEQQREIISAREKGMKER